MASIAGAVGLDQFLLYLSPSFSERSGDCFFQDSVLYHGAVWSSSSLDDMALVLAPALSIFIV